MLKLTLIPALLVFSWCVVGPQQEPTTSAPASSQPAGAPNARAAETATQPEAEATPPAIDPQLDQLLTRLEANAVDLTSFTAKIAYEKEDAVLGRREIRTGEIIYRIHEHTKTFAALFDSLTIVPPSGKAGRREQRVQHYVFDGRWLAEIDHQEKRFIKREIVAPGQALDPLKIGEGPFPLPIGQAKADVLARFEVSRIDVPGDGMLSGLTNVDGLLLKPRAGTSEARDYERVEIFYDRATLLPVGINAVEVNEDRKTVRLTEVRRNPELDAASLRKLDITEPDAKKWDVVIEPWRGP